MSPDWLSAVTQLVIEIPRRRRIGDKIVLLLDLLIIEADIEVD